MATLFEGRESLVALDAGPAIAASLAAAMNDPRAGELLAAHAATDDGFWPEPGSWMAAYRPYRVVDGVLQIPVKGVLLAGLSVAWGTYATGYPYIRRAFDRGLADPGVRGIALIVDTPGGTVAECFDLGDHIHAARGAKPIRAFAMERAYSAGYLVASSADVIVVARTGGVGSIGVVVGHVDVSEARKAAGIRDTLIFYGAHKTDGTSTAPLPEDVKALIQKGVDRLGEMFVADVARNRGLSADAVRATQALTYSSADALEIGLADEIGSLDAAVAAFATSLNLDTTEDTMSAISQEAHDTALATATASATAAGAAAAAARVTAILADPRSKGRERAAVSLAASSPGMTTEDVLAFVEANVPAATASAGSPTGRLDAIVPDPKVAPDASAPAGAGEYDPAASLAATVTGSIAKR